MCLIIIDAQVGFTEQDSKVAGIAHEEGKGCVICVNKWDAVEKDDKTMQEMREKLENDFSFMSYAPILFISAKTGQRLDKMFELIKLAAHSNAMRVTTGTLNDILAQATARVQPPTDKGRRLKIFYMTQASTCPPIPTSGTSSIGSGTPSAWRAPLCGSSFGKDRITRNRACKIALSFSVFHSQRVYR